MDVMTMNPELLEAESAQEPLDTGTQPDLSSLMFHSVDAASAITILETFYDDAAEQHQTWEYLKRALDEDRPL
jgi:hypothetical protein